MSSGEHDYCPAGPTGFGGYPCAVVRARQSGQSGAGLGLALALAGLVVGFLLASFGVGLLSAETGQPISGGVPMGVVAVSVDLGGLWIGLVGAVLLAARAGSGSVVREFGWRIRLWPDLPLGLAVGVGFQLLVVPLLYLPLQQLIPNLDQSLGQPARQLTGGSSGAGLAVVGLLVALGAPIVEELFFRGLLLRSLERAFGFMPKGFGATLAIVVSAVIFGLVHAETLQLLGLVAFGLVLGTLAHTTGRLGPSTVAHAAFNAVAVISLVVVR